MGMPKRRVSQYPALWLATHYENGPGGCMNWTRHTNQQGYGKMRIGSRRDGTSKVVFAHRLSASVWKGFDLNSKLRVLHKCDNPLCINPDHLFIGTQADNMADCKRKGRIRAPKGEKAGNSKLMPDQIVEIRSACADGAIQRVLAKQYGVSQSLVSKIMLRKIWAHIS